MTASTDQQDITEAPLTTTGTTVETEPTAAEARAEAGHKVLEMFAAVCGAPDDPAVATEANQALAELQALLDAP